MIPRCTLDPCPPLRLDEFVVPRGQPVSLPSEVAKEGGKAPPSPFTLRPPSAAPPFFFFIFFVPIRLTTSTYDSCRVGLLTGAGQGPDGSGQASGGDLRRSIQHSHGRFHPRGQDEDARAFPRSKVLHITISRLKGHVHSNGFHNITPCFLSARIL